MRAARRIVDGAVTALAVAALVSLLVFALALAAGLRPAVVKSGSMSPMLERGSLILVRPTPARALRVGQVITFADPRHDDGRTVTHRIVKITASSRGPVFNTQGDANNGRDPWNMTISKQAGVLAHDLPKVGMVSFWVRSKIGYALLLGIPVLWLAIGALHRLWSTPAPVRQAA